jgi:hypothetical protein
MQGSLTKRAKVALVSIAWVKLFKSPSTCSQPVSQYLQIPYHPDPTVQRFIKTTDKYCNRFCGNEPYVYPALNVQLLSNECNSFEQRSTRPLQLPDSQFEISQKEDSFAHPFDLQPDIPVSPSPLQTGLAPVTKAPHLFEGADGVGVLPESRSITAGDAKGLSRSLDRLSCRRHSAHTLLTHAHVRNPRLRRS